MPVTVVPSTRRRAPRSLTKDKERSLYDERSGCVGHNDEFVFRREVSADGHTRWLLGFYRHHTFTITVNAS